MSALTELYAQIANCHRCEIAKYRTNAVPGEGPENAEIVFIGEAPGWHEDQQGRPLVGQAGMYLEKLLAAIGMTRQQVYITNVIKTRPPDNREPLPIEVQNCRPWLDRQLELIRPKVIVTLGRYSLARLYSQQEHQPGPRARPEKGRPHHLRHVSPRRRPAPGEPAERNRG